MCISGHEKCTSDHGHSHSHHEKEEKCTEDHSRGRYKMVCVWQNSIVVSRSFLRLMSYRTLFLPITSVLFTPYIAFPLLCLLQSQSIRITRKRVPPVRKRIAMITATVSFFQYCLHISRFLLIEILHSAFCILKFSQSEFLYRCSPIQNTRYYFPVSSHPRAQA